MEFKVSTGTYHGFIWDDPSLLVTLRPFELQVSDSMDCCLVKPEVRTFCVCGGGGRVESDYVVFIVCCISLLLMYTAGRIQLYNQERCNVCTARWCSSCVEMGC